MESRPRSGHNCLFKPAEASHGAEGGLEEVISLTSGEEDAAEPRLREERTPPLAYPAVEASGEVSEGRVQVGASVDEKSASPVEPETSDDTGSTEPCPSTQSVPLAVHGQRAVEACLKSLQQNSNAIRKLSGAIARLTRTVRQLNRDTRELQNDVHTLLARGEGQ